MTETKLNFNAPLMSVRRIASRPTSPMPHRKTPADSTLDQVTDPVAVPFHWEHIPGRPKDDDAPPLSPPPMDSSDAFSDALDTLSSLGSPCGSHGGTFSCDPQTRDFMMNRFLPAAKAMAFEPPPRSYAAKKQPQQEQPRQVLRRVVGLGLEKKPTTPLPTHTVDRDEESDDESQVYNEPNIISARGCGFFPRLCFRNSLGLLGPLSALKLSSPNPPRTPFNQSTVNKAWDNHMKKSDAGSFSPHQKKADGSKRFSFSGELIARLSPFRNSRAADPGSTPKQKKPDVRSRSGELGLFESKGRAVESRRFTYSGELHRGKLSPFRNTRTAEPVSLQSPRTENKGRGGECRRLAYSGDLQRTTTPRAASISPYRNQSSQSPFRRGVFLGLPKEEKPVSKPGSKCREASGDQGCVEKTLYVDTDSLYSYSYSRSGYLGNKARFHSGEQLRRPRWVDEACEEFSFKDIKSVNNAVALEILEQEIAACDDEKKAASAKGDCKEDLLGVNSSLTRSPLPPPLPRSPSESWLWRTVPSISLRNSSGLKAQTKDPDPKTSPTGSTKWETIVKTSKTHHDHARYSQELVAHLSKQSSKT